INPNTIGHLLREVSNQWQRSHAARNDRLAKLAVMAHMSESVEITSMDISIEYVNPAFERRTGYSADEAIGKTPAGLMRSSGHDAKLFEGMEATCRRGEVWRGEMLAGRKNGEDDYILATIIPVLDHQGKIVKMCSLKQSLLVEGVDVNSDDGGRGALLQLLKSEERFRSLVNAAEDGLLVSDCESGQILSANQSAIDNFGYSQAEMRHKSVRMLSPESEQQAVQDVLKTLSETGQAGHAKLRMRRNDGSEFWACTRYRTFSTHGQTCFLTVLRDVSEEVERQQQLEAAKMKVAHGTRLAVVGRVAAGVAHEINNPATVVKHNLEFLEELTDDLFDQQTSVELSKFSEWREMIADALIGINRIQTVTEQLLGFTQVHHRGKSAVKLNEAIEMSLRFVRNEIDHRADLVLSLDEIAPLWLDESRIGQLFVNLLVNAAQAIEPGNREKNSIRVEAKEEDGDVCVRFCDTGCGMSELVLKQALDPFFSTKKAGKGTGLGLALCSETVSSYNGELTVSSEVGEGTCVEIRIPIDENRVPQLGQNRRVLRHQTRRQG
ncbi:MAG: PAS domain S-box protein, partial [Kofleriaceae bacterium]|nr:PAS domain S-box protein [Kofleriaceae bacterium]